MGFGQTMITVAFLVVLTLAVVSANKLIVDKEESFYRAEAEKEASYLANSLLNEILSKKFDNVIDTTSSTYQLPSAFSTYLGPEPVTPFTEWLGVYNYNSNWTYPIDGKTSIPYLSRQYFNDVDDYNAYERTEDTALLKGFLLTVVVTYVDTTSLNTSATQTYLKKITVTVTNSKYLSNALTFTAYKPYTF